MLLLQQCWPLYSHQWYVLYLNYGKNWKWDGESWNLPKALPTEKNLFLRKGCLSKQLWLCSCNPSVLQSTWNALQAINQILGCPWNPYPDKGLIGISCILVKDHTSLQCEKCTNIFIPLKSSHLWGEKGKRNDNDDLIQQNKIRKKQM